MSLPQENLQVWLRKQLDEVVDERMEELTDRIGTMIMAMSKRYEGDAKSAVVDIACAVRAYSLTHCAKKSDLHLQSNLKKLERDEKILELYRLGWRYHQIGETLGLAVSTVRQIVYAKRAEGVQAALKVAGY